MMMIKRNHPMLDLSTHLCRVTIIPFDVMPLVGNLFLHLTKFWKSAA